MQEEFTLDGANGVITGDCLQRIKDWRDIHSIFHENSHKPYATSTTRLLRDVDINYPSIRLLARIAHRSGSRSLPVTTTGKVLVTYRTKPDDFEEDGDEIYMDTQLLLLGTCWDVLEDDGTNPGASDKFRVLFQDALAQFNRQQHNIPTGH